MYVYAYTYVKHKNINKHVCETLQAGNEDSTPKLRGNESKYVYTHILSTHAEAPHTPFHVTLF